MIINYTNAINGWHQIDHCTWSKSDFLIIKRMDGFYMLTMPDGNAWMDTSLKNIDDVIKWADGIITAMNIGL